MKKSNDIMKNADKAMQSSINKWNNNFRAEKPEDAKMTDCPLCEEFIDNGCLGCPIASAGFKNCIGSPFDAAHSAHNEWKKRPWDDEIKNKFRKSASEMLHFLVELGGSNETRR